MKNYDVKRLVIGTFTGIIVILIAVNDAKSSSPTLVGCVISGSLGVVLRVFWGYKLLDTHPEADKRDAGLFPFYVEGDKALNSLMVNFWKWVIITLLCMLVIYPALSRS